MVDGKVTTGRKMNVPKQQFCMSTLRRVHLYAKEVQSLILLRRGGGPITYIIKEGSGINDRWILDDVVPTLHQRSALDNVKHRLHRQVCLIQGRASLWKIFDTCGSKLPAATTNQVKTAHNNIGTRCNVQAGENPVRKAPIGVTGADAELIIEELIGIDPNASNAPVAGGKEQQLAKRTRTTQSLRFSCVG